MTGYERISAAISGRKADCTPVMLHNFMMAAREAGFTMAQYREDPKKIAEAFIQSVEKYQFDGILVDIDTVTLAGAAGVPVDFPEQEPARVHLGCLSSLKEVDTLSGINVGDYKYVQIWLEAVRLLKNYFKNEIFVRGNCDQDPFALASMMRSPQEWYMDLINDETNALGLIEHCTDITCQFITLMAKTGADMLSNGDSPAGPDLISPQMYEKYALPFEKKVAQKAHSFQLPYALHICGNTLPILEQMMSVNADAYELDHKTDPRRAREVINGKATFIGNIDPSRVLAQGTADEVREKTEEILSVFQDTPRFILNAGCAIPATTPSENIMAMVKVARKGY